MIAWLARAQHTSAKTNCQNKRKYVLIPVLPYFFDSMDSKVEYRFSLSFKRQSNLHFWPLFEEKLWISVLNGRSPTKTARKFQPITGLLLTRQYIVILTSQKQSKETENRETSAESVIHPLNNRAQSDKIAVWEAVVHAGFLIQDPLTSPFTERSWLSRLVSLCRDFNFKDIDAYRGILRSGQRLSTSNGVYYKFFLKSTFITTVEPG